MAIITLSRGTFSGGRRLANCLAANLGYRVIAREALVQAAAESGVDERELARGLEYPPTLWDRLRITRQLYLAVIGAALCREVREGDVVYHGTAGHLLLAGIDHLLRVRAIAPFAARVREATEAHGFDVGEAERYIQRKDEDRIRWSRFLYGAEWHDPTLYDLVINLDKVTTEAACQTIACLAERPEYRLTPEGRSRIDDLALAYDVRARLFREPRIAAAAAALDVVVTDRELTLSGLLPNDACREDVLATARSTPGVRAVHADWLGGRVATV